MAKFTKPGWSMSREGEQRFREMYARINVIVRNNIRKYNLPGRDREDLMQEGRLAAACAVDTYDPAKGRLEGYINTCVSRALAMVASEALAHRRQPHRLVQDETGKWVKTPVSDVELESDMAVDEGTNTFADVRAHSMQMVEMSEVVAGKLAQLELSDDARQILQLRIRTPPELWVLARNVNNGRWKLELQCVCLYLGWVTPSGLDKARYTRAARELREQFRFVLGIDDQRFEPLKPIEVDTIKLQAGAKQRQLEGLR